MSARGPSRKSNRDLEKSTTQQNGIHSDTDQDLQQESQRQTHKSATTRSTVSSGKSRKSKKSTIEPAHLDQSNVVLSRGRPMKPHETEPFLTIDNLPPEKTFISEKSTLSGFGTPRNLQNKAPPITPKSPVLNQLQRMSVYMSPYSRETPGAPSPSVVSGKLSPNKVCKSPDLMAAKFDLNSGSRPNTGPQKERNSNLSVNRDTSADTVPTKVLKQTSDSDSKTELNIKENISRPSTGNRQKFDSRPSSSSKSGSRPGTGSRSGRAGSGVRQKWMRSLPSRAGRVTPANTPFQSLNKQLHSPNFHVKSPFKHNVSKPDFVCDGRNTPSMGMKERTALAAYHINKMIAVAGEKDAHKVRGQLKKGKLKPLYPVAVDGPTIDKCRGIISETRSYGSSPSRTLQRHLHLMSTIPNVHEYLYDRPRTVESVHRTSAASSIDDNSDYEDDNKLPDEIIYPAPKTGSILEPRTPENTFVPVPEPEEIQKQTADEKSQIVFATEISSGQPADNVNIPTQLQQALTVNNTEQQTDTLDQNNSNTVNSDLKAAEELEDDGNLGYPQVRVISSSKSVRFSDDKAKSSKEIKQITNNSIAMQQSNQEDLKDEGGNEDNTVAKKNKHNSAGCKSDEIKEFRKIDKDSDDEDELDNSKKEGNKDTSGTCSNNVVQSDNVKSGSFDTGIFDNNKNNEENNTAKDTEGVCETLENSTHPNGSIVENGRRSSRGIKKTHHKQAELTSKSSPARKLSSTDRLHKSVKNKTCSKFNKSAASKTNTHKLEVSSVIHGNSVQVSLHPESPNRSPSRTNSPSRQSHLFSRDWEPGFGDTDSWYQNRDSYENGIKHYYHSSSRSKVKFLLDNEEPEMETIFVEDKDDIKLKQDTQISFDTLEAEIMALRLNIRNDIGHTEQENEKLEYVEQESDSDSDTVIDPEENLDSNVAETVDSVRNDYNDILEKYRQQCMDRSERCGAISTLITTPRETGSLKSSNKDRHPGIESSLWHFDTESLNTNENLTKSQVLSNIVSSDSGHGSVENISELSQPTGYSTPEIPRLDLAGSTSDLDIETGRSETIQSEKTVEEEDQAKTNILKMMCDQLSPSVAKEQKESKENRQEELKRIMNSHRIKREEDVTKLKVVATTKSLSKSRRTKLTLSTNKAPYPPLCFTINARPPAGFLYYFAYGPDMNLDRFKNYIRQENVSRYWGLLLGFNLVFNKKGTSEEAGGFSNLEFNPLRSVEGCLYKITSQDLQVLDKCIGYPEHYQHLVLPVWMCNSANPDSLGVAQYCVPALMYIAQNKWTETERTLNCDYALSQCIKSADLVTKEYRDSLVAMGTQKENQIIETAA